MAVRVKGPHAAVMSVAMVGTLALAACGGSSGGGGGGGGGSASGGGGGGDAAAASRGPITYVQGKDNSNVAQPIVDKWNKAHPKEMVTLKQQSDQADQQHDDLVQHFQSKDPSYDVVSVDVIWTSEFAAKQWLTPLVGPLALDTSKILPAVVKTATYVNKLYAGPISTDGGILYYRKDLVKTPPKTYDELWKDCAIAKKNGMDCFAGQYAKYEGLTVNAAEAINSFGGTILGTDGKPSVTSAQAKAGLQNIADHYKNGDIPKQAITYQEEQGRQSFEAGKLLFLRNWPYVYSLATTDGSSKVKKTLAMAPLPGQNGPGASSLGGHNMAISAFSKHKATAIDFIKFEESEEIQKFSANKASSAPVLSGLYADAALSKKLPYLPVLKKALDNAVPRPVSPFYPAVTQAIQDNAYPAIKGTVTVDKATTDMAAALTSASAG